MFLKQKGKTWVNSISHVKEVKYLGTICRLKLALSVSDWKYLSEPNDWAFPGSLSYCHTTSAHKPFLFTASHHHTYNSILTNFSPQSVPRSKKQVFEITTVSEAGGNRASGEQWVFLSTTGDFSVIIDDRAAAYSMETDQMTILTAWAFQTYPRRTSLKFQRASTVLQLTLGAGLKRTWEPVPSSLLRYVVRYI